jgi:membrane protein DedA with SNARE-associated domain
VLLLAAGALTAEGVLGYLPTVLSALMAAVVGDCIAYGLGRWAGRPLLERAGPSIRISGDLLARAERAFNRWGGGAVWLSRWLVTAAGPPVSLLAGADAYPFRLFAVFALAGEALWAAGYVGLGWLFGDNWSDLLDLVDNLTWFGAAAIAAAVLALVAWRLSRR